MKPNDIPVGTHCEWCGAEFDEAVAPERRPSRKTRVVVTPRARPAGAEEPATHCEWCGAQYPVPDDETK